MIQARKLALVAAVVLAVAVFFGLGLHEQLTFESIKASQARIQDLYRTSPWMALGWFVGLYLLVVTLNLPGATLMGLLGGAVFGGLMGTVVVSFASSLGATLACLLSRTLLRDWVRRTFPTAVATIDQGMAREGAFYLFSLRLIPVIPFFVINLAMGLTAMPLRTFYWVSQLGMLPGTIVYVNAGSELGRLTSPAGIFSPRLLLALVLLGLLPLAGKKGLAWYRRKKGMRAEVVLREAAPSGPPSAAVVQEARAVAAGCTDCQACVRQCPFLQETGTPGAIARAVLEADVSTDVSADAFACSLCGLCGEVCPEKLQPAALFLALRRQAVSRGTVELSRYATLLGYEKRGHSVLFAWYPPAATGTVFFPGCTLPGTRPAVTWQLFLQLREIVPDLGMVLDCCHKPSHDLGRQDYFLEQFCSIRDKLLALGVHEVLVACPNCYKVFVKYGNPLRVTTVYELLAAQDRPAVALESEAAAVAVHDPCPLRAEPGIHAAVRTLLAARGVPVATTKHAGRRTLCCGEGGGVGFYRPDFARAWTARRKELAGERRIVTYCAGCAGFLGRVAPTTHLVELLLDPERALAGRCKVAKAPMTYVHRLRLKRRLQRMQRMARPDRA